tara:strand:- start:8145 stop:8705 length:561 start_codon:yes stop_codon:yes gene_type:complete
MKKLLNWIIDKWLAGFITGFIFFVIKIYYDLPDERKFNFFNFDWFVGIINYKISFWVVILIITGILVITRFERYLYHKFNINKVSENRIPLNSFSHYTSDVFGVNKNKWNWNYNWNSLIQQFEIEDLNPVCKVCSAQMKYSNSDYGHYSATCPKCRLEGRESYFPIAENIADVESEIIRKIKDKEI